MMVGLNSNKPNIYALWNVLIGKKRKEIVMAEGFSGLECEQWEKEVWNQKEKVKILELARLTFVNNSNSIHAFCLIFFFIK